MNNISKILTLDHISVGYQLSRKKTLSLLKDIYLEVNKGDVISLVGKNGTGKSTLLRIIANLQNPLKGKIKLLGENIHYYNRIELSKLFSYVSTNPIYISNMNVFELVALGRIPYTNIFGKLTNTDKKIIQKVIKKVGISHLAHKNIYQISDGERQRAIIARALAQNTELIILDEPTAFLDLPNRYEIIYLLNKLSKDEKKTIIFSTHDLNIALQEADKIWLIHDKKIIEGAPEDLIINKSIHNILKDSTLELDITHGEIKHKKVKYRSIAIHGIKDLVQWTERALERYGYYIDKNSEIIITVQNKNNKPSWELQLNNNKIVLNSIYNLILYLK